MQEFYMEEIIADIQGVIDPEKGRVTNIRVIPNPFNSRVDLEFVKSLPARIFFAMFALELEWEDGTTVQLCDFASASEFYTLYEAIRDADDDYDDYDDYGDYYDDDDDDYDAASGDCPRCGRGVGRVIAWNTVNPNTDDEHEGSVPYMCCDICGWKWWKI